MSEAATSVAIESVVRDSYGRLVAYLAARSGDVAGAEDALGDAFVAALKRWSTEGVPEKPEAWLLHVPRNRMIDAVRRKEVRQKSETFLQQIAEEAQAVAKVQEYFPDERLKLLFVCAHPAIDPAAQTPLMLQAVLGIDAARIASAFLVSPAAMSQRLVRAKNKIRDAGIPFRVPEPPEWEERVSFVLDAIYAAYTTGWESLMETASTHHALAAEAITLARMLTQLMPREPEALGLLALILHCEARREARYTTDGEFVPLDQQDMALWSQSMIDEAERHLHSAAAFKRMGRYQLEAAIQSVHASRAKTGNIDWKEIALLYEGLARIAPGIGSLVGRAVAIAQTGELASGFAALEQIPAEQTADYQPYWAARGHLLRLLNRNDEAVEAFNRAASLTDDPALRDYLFKRAAANIWIIGPMRNHMKNFSIRPIGFIRSELRRRKQAPRQGFEGAPNALIEVLPPYRKALDRMQVGGEIIVITWLHRAKRNVVKVHPRGDESHPLTGVFSTRSPDRPNPLGLHRVKVWRIHSDRLLIGPIEAIEGTPVVDIKPVLESTDS